MRVREAIIRATQVLRNKNIDEPELEAFLLVAHALKVNRTSLYLNYDKVLSGCGSQAISRLLNRRLNHEPLEYLTNKVSFMGIEFIVELPVFIPRPETEVLVEALVKLAESRGTVHRAPTIIFDIGTGCGAIGIAILKFLPQAIVYASDIIDLSLARRNAVKNEVSDRIIFLRGNLLDPFKLVRTGVSLPLAWCKSMGRLPDVVQPLGGKCKVAECFADFIVSNPPYIPTSQISELQPEIKFFESHSSIDGKRDGLFFIRELIRTAVPHLKRSGALLLEISPEQENKVRQEALIYFKSVNFVNDFSGKTRVLVAKDILTK